MLFRQFLAAFFTSIAGFAMPALATPQPIDATDLWFNPSESGWGLSVFHQGDTLFASLFVYGPDGQPKWYTASNLAPGPFVFTGPLVESSGPWFGERFDSDDVGRRIVGSMTFTLAEAGATVTYIVDGVVVSKPVVRASLRVMNLAGPYYGVLLQPAGVSGSEKLFEDQHILVNDNGSTLEMDMASNRTPNCYYPGSSRSQNGEVVVASGQTGPQCVTRPGPWRMAVDPTPHGFVGNFSDANINDGRIAAALRSEPRLQGTGWANDLWYRGDSPGWGLNFIEQGDAAFATLFVYDAKRRPHWYSASQLLAMGDVNGWPTWSGTLEESTGPYFGGQFDPSAVKRRVVGTMTFSANPFGPANEGRLAYTIDGVSVTTLIERYAFRDNNMFGSYQGHVVMRSDDPRGLSYDDATFDIAENNRQVTMDIHIATGPRCTFTSSVKQYGSQMAIAGNCTGSGAPVVITDLMVTANGFTATYSGPAGHIGGMITKGHISGARR
jgi:hypothetical protein